MALITCPDCQREISSEATACPGCGRKVQDSGATKGIAAILSLFIPGLGQVLRGDGCLNGCAWFGFAAVFWVTGMGWIIHILSAVCAGM